MKTIHLTAASCLSLIACSFSWARVLVTDSGVQTVTIGPGAPAHTIGLQGHRQVITLDTGKQIFGLRYVVARDPKNAQAAIPGEGYIGMPQPLDCNWYGGGFFDLQINGQSIGTTFIHSLTGRGSAERGTADFVFDTSLAFIRVRFVVKAGGDCLFAQVLLEPKQEIKSVRVATRCYPSGFITNGARHVRTATRDFPQGDRAVLDVEKEWWTLYYDTIYDAGYIAPNGLSGAGSCAMLWLPGQTEKVGFNVGSYGTDTVLDLKPALRDFRFVFFDYAGQKNEAAMADLQGRAQPLQQELATFPFTDPIIARWPLAQKQAEVQQALALVPEEKEASAQYDRWAQELAVHLKALQTGGAGVIVAEANAAKIISEWERGLPELRLKALLREI